MCDFFFNEQINTVGQTQPRKYENLWTEFGKTGANIVSLTKKCFSCTQKQQQQIGGFGVQGSSGELA